MAFVKNFKKLSGALQRQMSGSSSSLPEITISGPTLPDLAPSAKRLFLIRHGEVINPGGDRPVYYGSMDVPLSPLGKDEAIAAGQYLKAMDLQFVACSPLSRAVFGASKIIEWQTSCSPDPIVLKGFTELDRGVWCGLTIEEIGSDLMKRFDACDELVTPEGGESYSQLWNRVKQARDEALSKLENGRAAAIVSHLQVTRCILHDALRVPLDQVTKLKVATASITCVDYEGDKSTVHFQSFKPDVGLDFASP